MRGSRQLPRGLRQAGQSPSPPGRARTHFADSVLMEPVTSISPARNSWYLIQAMAVEMGSATLQGSPATSAITRSSSP